MRILEELDELLAEAGLGWIPSNTMDANCTGPFQIRMLYFNTSQFLDWISALSARFGLPAPRQLDFLRSYKLRDCRSCMDSAYLFNLEGLILLKDLIQTALENGEPKGFMTIEP